MSNRIFSVGAACAFALFGQACSLDNGSDDELDPSGMPGDAGSADPSSDPAVQKGREILSSINQASYATSGDWYPLFEESSEPRPQWVDSQHPARVAIYQNHVAAEAMQAWEQDGFPMPLSLPDGAIILKHNYAPNDAGELEHMATTVMKKDTSLDDADYPGQWFWIKATPDLQVMQNDTGGYLAGALTGCINCHDGETNFGVFPDDSTDPPDPLLGGEAGAIRNHDFVITAYCRDPETEECSVEVEEEGD